jgi:hypothetical protein
MKEIITFLTEHQSEALWVLGAIVVLSLIITNWAKLKFWLLTFWYNFSFIGRMARISKDIDGFDENHKWFYSEERLCGDYYHYYAKVDKDGEAYEEAKAYLYSSGELGRKPTPTLIWIMIFLLVAIEAMGFAYVLAGFTIPGASEATQQKGAIGVALMLAIILVWLTHMTGEELHKNSLIKKIRRWYKNDNKEGTNKRDLRPESRVITLDNTNDDADAPTYVRMLNRVDVNEKVTPVYTKTFLTIVFVIVVAFGATYIRGLVLNEDISLAHQDASSSIFGASSATDSADDINGLFADTGDNKAVDAEVDSLFGDDTSTEATATKGESIEDETKRKGSWATFVILGVMFVFIQILGVFFGIHWGFAGRESMIAYESLKGFSSKKEFLNYYSTAKTTIARLAQRQLQKLQHKMNIINDEIGTDAETSVLLKNNKDRTFNEYLKFEDK